MTLKNAAAGLPHGGGKSVLYADPRMPLEAKERLVRAMACALGDCQEYVFGPDMGTDETCMAWIRDEIGRAVGLPREIGGIPLDEIGATGWGLAAAADVAARERDIPLSGARVVVQGFGSVGIHAARFLAEKGARIVAVSDSRGAVVQEEGLDIETLAALKQEGKSVADHGAGRVVDRDSLVGVACEIWVPAARPDVIHEGNVDELETKLVVAGANIAITAGAERTLHERGVLCVPDFIANAGGVICAAMELAGSSQPAAMAAIEEKIRSNTAEVLRRSREGGVSPRDAAVDLARSRVLGAQRYRRWGH
jgi:glutamate dehydrogenase (NAD(P)+)